MTTSSFLGRVLSMPYALMLPMLPIVALCTAALLYAPPHYRQPEEIPYWAFFFGLPHIISSFQTMCDREYLAAYRERAVYILLLVFLPLVAFQAGVPASMILAVVLALTIHHLVAQQFGIALSVARLRPSAAFLICKWGTILLGTMAYFRHFSTDSLWGTERYLALVALTDFLMLPLLVVILVTGILLVVKARERRAGAILLALNISCFVLSILLIFMTPYVLVGLMIIRILHDASGFVVYVGHDISRNRDGRKNILYRAIPFVRVGVLNLLYAVTIAAGLTYLANRVTFIGWLVVGITIAHYYSESFIWRGGTPHRQHFGLAGSPGPSQASSKTTHSDRGRQPQLQRVD